jgi:hypothetical protein
MLRGNLSSRPFFNDRLVTLALAAVAAVSLALAAFDVRELMTLSTQRAELVATINRDDTQAERIRSAATALQKTVDQRTLQVLAAETREANLLIDQRTFSWTTFFGLLEKTLPLDVHLIAVAPKIDKGQIKVTMTVVARRAPELQTFVQALWDTNAFYDVSPHRQQRNDDGTISAEIESYYYPPNAPAVKPPKAAGKERP